MIPSTKQRSAARRNIKKAVGATQARKSIRKLPKKTRTATDRQTSTLKRRVKHVLFVQGGGRDTHDSWDNKLVASLKQALGSGYRIRYPRMPDEADPDPVAWKKVITRELRRLSDGVILVGHSLGAAILIDYLGDGSPKHRLAGVFLIAPPFMGDGGWPSDDLRPTKELVSDLPEGAPLYLYQGSDDETVPSSHIGMFAKTLPHATIRRFEGRNHQLNDDLSEVARDISLLG
jgi:predicted alpha/beta hydrolase family esterase